MKKLSIITALVLGLLVSPSLFDFGSPPASAQFSLGLPFGGMVSMVEACPCNGAVRVTVGLPVPTVYLAYLSSLVYPFGMNPVAVHPGQWNLGLITPSGDMCRSIVKCAPLVTSGVLTPNITHGRAMLGTSI